MPASRASSPKRITENGASSIGLITTVLPTASAGPALRHAERDAAVPGGDDADDAERLEAGVVEGVLGEDRDDRALELVGVAGVVAEVVGAPPGQAGGDGRGHPASRPSTLPMVGASRSTRAARRSKASRRSSGRHRDHTAKAARAAATASAISAGPAIGTSAWARPVVGFTWWNTPPLRGGGAPSPMTRRARPAARAASRAWRSMSIIWSPSIRTATAGGRSASRSRPAGRRPGPPRWHRAGRRAS